MKKKASLNTLFWALASFFIAGLVMLVFVNRMSMSEGISVYFFKSIDSQVEDVIRLRHSFNLGRVYIHDCLADIITGHLYPSFILALIFGGKAASMIFKIFFYIRFGMLAFSMHILCSRSFKLEPLWASLFAFAYAFSSLGLASGTNPLLMNLMIILPLITAEADFIIRDISPKVFWRGLLIFSLLIGTGMQGIITGLLYLVTIMWILSCLVPGSKFLKGLEAVGLSVIPMLLVIIPAVFSGLRPVNIVSAFKDGHVLYTTFDLLISFFDGVGITLPPDSQFAPIGLSVLVLVLALLFFINGKIPFKARISAFIVIVLYLVSCASSTVREILSVYGFDQAGAFMRMEALSVILFVMACVSFKNLSLLKREQYYTIAFSLLALIVISNVNSASEVTRSPFYLYFSAAAVIFWCTFLHEDFIRDNRKAIAIACVGALGLTVNLYQELKISSFSGDLSTMAPYSGTVSGNQLATVTYDAIPLCGTNNEFIAVEQDLRSEEELIYPEVLNTISNSLFLQDAYIYTDSFCVFSSGVIVNGLGTYSVVTPLSPIEILIRCENMNPNAAYFIYSSFKGNTSYSQSIASDDIVIDHHGPFMSSISRGRSATLRLAGEPSNQFGHFSVWEENHNSINELRSHIKGMDDYSFVVEDNKMSSNPNLVTVVTSVPYSERYNVEVKDSSGIINCEVVNICGKLSFVYQGDGVSDYSVRIKTAYGPLAFSIVIWFISIAIVIYNICRKRIFTPIEEVDVKQEDN